jgi:tetratricopeptide (TPR) repeat protein
MKMLPAVLAVSLLIGSAPLAAAPVLDDSARGQKLDDLFQQLKSAPTQSDGLALEEQIDDIWIQSGDPRIDQQMQLAIKAMDGQFYDTALKYLSNIIITKPNFAEAWNKRATLYYMVGDYQDSLKDIAQTLVLEPRHFGAIAGKGMVELKLGDNQAALSDFKQALAIAPSLQNIQVEVYLLEGGTTGPGQRT